MLDPKAEDKIITECTDGCWGTAVDTAKTEITLQALRDSIPDTPVKRYLNRCIRALAQNMSCVLMFRPFQQFPSLGEFDTQEIPSYFELSRRVRKLARLKWRDQGMSPQGGTMNFTLDGRDITLAFEIGNEFFDPHLILRAAESSDKGKVADKTPGPLVPPEEAFSNPCPPAKKEIARTSEWLRVPFEPDWSPLRKGPVVPFRAVTFSRLHMNLALKPSHSFRQDGPVILASLMLVLSSRVLVSTSSWLFWVTLGLSILMLAFVIFRHRGIPTIIFDQINGGIWGGNTREKQISSKPGKGTRFENIAAVQICEDELAENPSPPVYELDLILWNPLGERVYLVRCRDCNLSAVQTLAEQMAKFLDLPVLTRPQ